MAQDKFEKDLKNKLGSRFIKPSNDAWERLSHKLDRAESTKSNRSFWLIGIAASIVIVLFFTLKGFNNNASKNEVPIVVDTKSETHKETQAIENSSKNEKVIIEQKIEEPIVSIENKPKKMTVKKAQAPLEVETKNSKQIAEVENVPDLQIKQHDSVRTQPISFEEQKIQEVVAQIQEIKNLNNKTSEDEIDKLLKQAESQIKLQKLYNETNKTVDASSLLKEVEEDLDQSFRDKVLKALMESYETVKTAVVQRNE